MFLNQRVFERVPAWANTLPDTGDRSIGLIGQGGPAAWDYMEMSSRRAMERRDTRKWGERYVEEYTVLIWTLVLFRRNRNSEIPVWGQKTFVPLFCPEYLQIHKVEKRFELLLFKKKDILYQQVIK